MKTTKTAANTNCFTNSTTPVFGNPEDRVFSQRGSYIVYCFSVLLSRYSVVAVFCVPVCIILGRCFFVVVFFFFFGGGVGGLFAAFKSLADYRTKAINHQKQVYWLKTAKYKCMMFWDSGGGSFTIPGFYFSSHISSLCKVVLMKDRKIHRLLFKLGNRP